MVGIIIIIAIIIAIIVYSYIIVIIRILSCLGVRGLSRKRPPLDGHNWSTLLPFCISHTEYSILLVSIYPLFQPLSSLSGCQAKEQTSGRPLTIIS